MARYYLRGIDKWWSGFEHIGLYCFPKIRKRVICVADNAYEKRLTGFIIHGFAVTHAATAALLSQTMVGDEAALTALTIAMIICIARINKRSWDVGDALSILGVLAGWYLGTRGALLLIKWMPVLGNTVNAVTTFGVTELIGWTTFLLVKENKKPQNLTASEKKSIRSDARKLREEESEESKRLFERMESADKKEYTEIMRQLKKKDLPEDTIVYLSNRLSSIASKYV